MLFEFLKEIEAERHKEEVKQILGDPVVDVSPAIEVRQPAVGLTAQGEDASCCEICNQGKQNYKCPKCDIHYCSLACYKQHNQGQCLEDFSKQ